MKTFLLCFGLLIVGTWVSMAEHVIDRHRMAACGAGLLTCWLGMSLFDDWRDRRVRAARTAEARVLEEVTEDLALARRLLPASGSPDWMARFDEAILRGDLAAALVELESIGLANGPIPEYWHALAAASARMGMDEVRVRLDGWGGRGASIEGRAEPGAASDRGRMSAFRGSLSLGGPGC